MVEQVGHEAVVANARELEAVTGRSHRSDHHDARQLARLARVDTALLNPVELRGIDQQADLFVVRARAVLVEARTMLINFARGVTKTLGGCGISGGVAPSRPLQRIGVIARVGVCTSGPRVMRRWARPSSSTWR